jgi:hypothetical protein
MFLLKTKPFFFLTGHLFHQILPKMRNLILHFKTFFSKDLFVNNLTEKFSQRRKSFKIRSSSNQQSETPGFNKKGRLIFLFPFQAFSRINSATKNRIASFSFHAIDT